MVKAKALQGGGVSCCSLAGSTAIHHALQIKAAETMHLFNSNGYKCKQLILFIQSLGDVTSIDRHYVALWTFWIVTGANVKVWDGLLPGYFKSFIRAFIRECFHSITLLVYAKQGADCWDVWKGREKDECAGTQVGESALADWVDYLKLKL